MRRLIPTRDYSTVGSSCAVSATTRRRSTLSKQLGQEYRDIMISINCRQEPVGWVMRVCVDQPLVTIVVFSVMFAYAEGKLKYRADKRKAIDGDLG